MSIVSHSNSSQFLNTAHSTVGIWERYVITSRSHLSTNIPILLMWTVMRIWNSPLQMGTQWKLERVTRFYSLSKELVLCKGMQHYLVVLRATGTSHSKVLSISALIAGISCKTIVKRNCYRQVKA